MTTDAWSRPTLDDLKEVLAAFQSSDEKPAHNRAAERLELSVPADVVTSRGNKVPAMTRDISRFGIGLLFRGSISPGEITVTMASDTREYKYRVQLHWSQPTTNGMWIGGGEFLGKLED